MREEEDGKKIDNEGRRRWKSNNRREEEDGKVNDN